MGGLVNSDEVTSCSDMHRARSGIAQNASRAGIRVAILSLIVMSWLARGRRRIARALNNGSLCADSVQTSVYAYLSAILLSDPLG